MKLDMDAFMASKSCKWIINVTYSIFIIVGLGGQLMGMLGIISDEVSSFAWSIGSWTVGVVFGTMITLAWLQGITQK